MRTLMASMVLLCAPILGAAQDCLLIPDKSFCGVVLTSPRDAFIKTLGEPDGQIKMGANRLGYIYGSRLLLIFQNDKLWEIDAWESNPNIDFWEYIDNQPARSDMRLKFETWSPWGLTRKQVGKHDAEFPVDDADMFVEARKSGSADMGIYYLPDSDLTDNNDWESYKVQSIRVNLGSAATPK